MSYRGLGADFYTECNSKEYKFDVASGYSSAPGGPPCPGGKEVVIEQTGKECRYGQAPCKWVCTYNVPCQTKKLDPVTVPSAPVAVTQPSSGEESYKAAVLVAVVAAGAAIFFWNRHLSCECTGRITTSLRS